MVETLARFDLPIRLGEDAGVVLEGTIAGRDEMWQLARVTRRSVAALLLAPGRKAYAQIKAVAAPPMRHGACGRHGLRVSRSPRG